MSQLVTGEAVALDLRPAALPSRILAGAVDLALQLVLLAVVGGVATAVSLDVSEAAAAALGVLVVVLVLVVYPVTFETLLRGRTPGKAAMGLRVVRDDGGPIGFRQALVRGLTGAAIERPGITLFMAFVFTSLLNRDSKRVGDLLAGTVVVRERVTAKGGAVATMPPQLAGWAAGLDLSRLPDGLALSARQFVARADELTDAAREDLGGRLVRAVTDAVGPPPPGTPGWAVLSAVLAERRRRETERLTARSGGLASSRGQGAAAWQPDDGPLSGDAGQSRGAAQPGNGAQPQDAAQPERGAPAEDRTGEDRADEDRPRPAPGAGGFALPG